MFCLPISYFFFFLFRPTCTHSQPTYSSGTSSQIPCSGATVFTTNCAPSYETSATDKQVKILQHFSPSTNLPVSHASQDQKFAGEDPNLRCDLASMTTVSKDSMLPQESTPIHTWSWRPRFMLFIRLLRNVITTYYGSAALQSWIGAKTAWARRYAVLADGFRRDWWCGLPAVGEFCIVHGSFTLIREWKFEPLFQPNKFSIKFSSGD